MPDLLAAERRLVEHCALDLRTGDEEADDPAGGAEWPSDRTVRAEVLRDVLLADEPTRVRLAGARITGTLDMEGMTVGRSVVLAGCHIEERPNLQDAELVSLRLPGCRLSDGLDARGCRLRGNLELSEAFCAEGPVLLAGASVAGLIWASGRFLNGGGDALNGDGLSTEGSVLLWPDMEAEGQVSLVGARIGGLLSLDGARLRNREPERFALRADGLTVRNSLFMRYGFRAEGAVFLMDTEVHGECSCMGGHFSNRGGRALQADRLKVHGGMLCHGGFRAEGEVKLVGAWIEGQLAFVDAVVSNPDARALDLEATHVGSTLFLGFAEPLDGWVNLTNAEVGSLNDSAAAWHTGYELRGCRYRRLRSTWDEPGRRRWLRRDPSVEHRLEWLAGNRDGYLPQLYDQLIEVYGAAGEEKHQREVLIAKQRRRRAQLPWYAWVWNLAVDALIGFGYRTGRALIPFVAFLAFGTWFFGSAYEDGEIVERSTAPTINEPPFKAFIYSLDQLVPVVNFGQRENWVATGDAQTLVTVMIVIGWILTTAILAALTGLVRRNQ